MSLRSFSPLLCLALAACQGGDETPAIPEPSATATATTSPTASASASAAPSGANAVKETNDLYSFSYSWPAAAGNIPALAQRLIIAQPSRKRLQGDAD